MTYVTQLRSVLMGGSAILMLAASSFAVQAATVVALSGDDRLTMIDTAAKKVTASMKVTGVEGRLLGIDMRPADGMLYGLMADGTVVTIDKSGKATQKSKLDTAIPASASMVTVDFNPVADRLRIIGSDGTNLRANVDDGKVTTDGALKYADSGNSTSASKPIVIGGAYTNSVKGAKETTLYDIDGTTGALLKQVPPNDGMLIPVGKLGPMPKMAAFDIETEASGNNKAWLIVDNEIYGVDLTTGKATSAGKIANLPSETRDIAILASM